MSGLVARKLNPETNIWTTSKPVLENWLRETKDPLNSINETLQNTSEAIKRLPELPEIMDKANQALTFLASGQIPQNSNSYTALNNKKSEMIAFRNQSLIGLLKLYVNMCPSNLLIAPTTKYFFSFKENLFIKNLVLKLSLPSTIKSY